MEKMIGSEPQSLLENVVRSPTGQEKQKAAHLTAEISVQSGHTGWPQMPRPYSGTWGFPAFSLVRVL